jgi:hypothetical protein
MSQGELRKVSISTGVIGHALHLGDDAWLKGKGCRSRVEEALDVHKNHRRKNRYRSPYPRHYVNLGWWKTDYWRWCRAIERECLDKARYDEIPVRHPRSILYDAS